MRGRFSVVIMLVGVAVAGCNGDSSGGSCARPDPCGGDVVGTWKIVDSCVEFTVPPLGLDFCPQATADITETAFSGGATYNADLTYSSTLTLAYTFVLRLPTSCLSSGGGTVTCADFNDALQAQLTAHPDPDIQSYTCASGGSSCNCTVVPTPQTELESGTYSTTGGRITSTPTGDAPSNENYCVQGDTLHLLTDESDVDASGQLILARQ